MKSKRILSILLICITLVACIAGCGKQTETAEGQGVEDTQGADESAEEPYVVKMIALGDATTESSQMISEALSEISMELYNVKVEVVKGYTVEQLNLMLTSGEKVDLVPAFPWEVSLSTLAMSGQILPLDDLLKEYGKETLEAISELDWKCTSVNGKIYGVRNNNDLAANYSLIMRKDIVEQLGIDYENVKTYEDVEAVLKLVKENTDLYPLVSSVGDIAFEPYDGAGDTFGVIENVLESDGETVFVNWYETETYKEHVEMMRRWNQEGLIEPDATSNTASGERKLAANGFAYIHSTKPGVETQVKNINGVEVVCAEIMPAISTTERARDCYAIAAGSENPEAAMQVLNMLYTNPDAANILANGIEGIHYVYVDDDRKVIAFPEGQDSSSLGNSVDIWSTPNEALTPVREGEDLDLRDQMQEFNKNAFPSPAKGFVFDSSNVMNELTACNNIVAKYKNGLATGELDPEEVLPILNEELKAAGLEKIIAEKQKQFDAWFATN